jgi:hypothetical protein
MFYYNLRPELKRIFIKLEHNVLLQLKARTEEAWHNEKSCGTILYIGVDTSV